MNRRDRTTRLLATWLRIRRRGGPGASEHGGEAAVDNPADHVTDGEHAPGGAGRGAGERADSGEHAAGGGAFADEGDAGDGQDEVGDLIRMVAREGFGFEGLRDGQLEAMRAVLAGRDTLCVLPTGGGKSAVYQIPALVLAGPAVVVSPLIALQRDQVRRITERMSTLIGPTEPTSAAAVVANSDAGAAARRAAFDAVRQGQTEFLFLAPEQLARPDVRAALREAKPSLFVVDEAHCVASWGHGFRPDYLRLGQVIEELGHPTVVALTATAAPPVRREIRERLRMRECAEVVSGFDRPEISLSVVSFTSEEDKRASLIERIAAEAKPALVYAATRRATEELAAEVSALGLTAHAYHAGLRAARRREIEAAFIGDRCDVVIATTAFGMGIDKPNVRTVIHAEVADSLDSYYQEIGRAGRDGQPALACLFYRPQDLGLRRFQASGQVDETALQRVAVLLGHAEEAVTARELAQAVQLRAPTLSRLVDLLVDAEAVVVHDDGRIATHPDAPEPREAARRALAVAESRAEIDRSRVEMIRAYAETRTCRRSFLLAYFGESTGPCGNCDICGADRPGGRTASALEGRAVDPPGNDANGGGANGGNGANGGGANGEAETAAQEQPFPAGCAVRHVAFGDGQVVRVEGDQVTVLFDGAGYRTLSAETVQQRSLLARA
ncbi:RecQ family ATP-dependent DNA helicase [Frankia sp. Ag45/Mut15]|uniref:ATP-dependent DNA helicase RecQ n=1 Tax=Frankia umida TaxID=573489 RepID=A0ABT0JVR1_9ACTN|nr:RecQ family ATP-dependent DNA helicase [Frankia umida]MCK9875641.1 RecQ family ATP-dependent DNA helicase [Frankia umida]